MKVIVVVGTRPELIKMYPVVRELENHSLNYFILPEEKLSRTFT